MPLRGLIFSSVELDSKQSHVAAAPYTMRMHPVER